MGLEKFYERYIRYRKESDRVEAEEVAIMKYVVELAKAFSKKHKVNIIGYYLTPKTILVTFVDDMTLEIETIHEDITNQYPKRAVVNWYKIKFESFIDGNANKQTLNEYVNKKRI